MTTLTATSTPSVRGVLLIDAATCAGMGLLLVAIAGPLAPLLSLPETLLRYAGLLLLPIAAFICWVATRTPPSPWGALAAVTGNVLWIAASIALLVGPWVSPNVLGQGFIVGQAGTVAVLTALELAGLRRFG